MKSVLISIQPKWCELIANGKKTLEVRKSRPNIETPFKVYIYCTYGNEKENYCVGKRGKVIGEFVCDKIICTQAYFDSQGKNHLTNVFEEDIERTCLTEYDLWDYIAGKAVKANQMYDGYLWHISDLKIYDKPKELGEFFRPCPFQNGDNYGGDCLRCDFLADNDYGGKCTKVFSRPPQSWSYVEE